MTGHSPIPGTETNELAHEIYQRLLDISTQHVFDGDTAAFAAYVDLPYIYTTGAGELLCETREELCADVQKIHDWLKSSGATSYHRIARRARFTSSDVIEGFHVTYALIHAVPVIEPYGSRMILRRTDGVWRASLSQHELATPLFSDRPVTPVRGLYSAEWGEEPDRTTRDLTEASTAYQSLIDAMSDANFRQDFDAWIDLFAMPHQIHYNAVDHVVTAPDDLVPFFDALCASMTDLGVDQFIRRTTFAAFITDDRLLGYHDTTMIKDGAICFGPVKSRMIFVHTDAGWKCSSVTNALSNSGFPGGAFQPSAQFPTLRQIRKRMRK